MTARERCIELLADGGQPWHFQCDAEARKTCFAWWCRVDPTPAQWVDLEESILAIRASTPPWSLAQFSTVLTIMRTPGWETDLAWSAERLQRHLAFIDAAIVDCDRENHLRIARVMPTLLMTRDIVRLAHETVSAQRGQLRYRAPSAQTIVTALLRETRPWKRELVPHIFYFHSSDVPGTLAAVKKRVLQAGRRLPGAMSRNKRKQ
ncbi:MAG: hypothetical protein JWN44_2973 [Myxococcales bacterium]|nr:hypothetical protein [Myxococcales bacterium]